VKLFRGKIDGYPGRLQKDEAKGKILSQSGRSLLPGRVPTGKAAWRVAAAAVLFLTILSCTGHIVPAGKASHGAAYKAKHAARHKPRHTIKHPPARGKLPSSDSEVVAKLEQAWRIWRGTPHRLGGTTRRGVDCSGLVQVLYRDLFGISLPRTVSAQVKLGRKVARRDLRPGDLVFFHPPGKYRHVGIYMGNQRFLHTSARHGVMVSRISDYFWKDCYWTARRHW